MNPHRLIVYSLHLLLFEIICPLIPSNLHMNNFNHNEFMVRFVHQESYLIFHTINNKQINTTNIAIT